MPSPYDNSNSFIPKKATNKQRWTPSSKRISILTVLAYSCIFAALLSAGAMFLYNNYSNTQLENEVVLLDSAVNSFSVQDVSRIQEFDTQLQQATNLVNNTVSVVVILDELNRVIAQPVQLLNLEVERVGDSELAVTTSFTATDIDAALFQRNLMSVESNIFSSITVSEIELLNEETPDTGVTSGVVFIANFIVPIEAVLFDPALARRTEIQTQSTNIQFNNLPAGGVPPLEVDLGSISDSELQVETNQTAI